MSLVFPATEEQKEKLVKWGSQRIGIREFGPCAVIGVEHREELVAVAIYSEYRPPNIEITFVTSSPRWASPNAVRAIIRYPLVQLGCKRITAITEATNQPARAFLCRLGFEQEGIHPDALPTGDAVTYGLLAKNASRWIEEKAFVKRQSKDSSSAGPDCHGSGANAIKSNDSRGPGGPQ